MWDNSNSVRHAGAALSVFSNKHTHTHTHPHTHTHALHPFFRSGSIFSEWCMCECGCAYTHTHSIYGSSPIVDMMEGVKLHFNG